MTREDEIRERLSTQYTSWNREKRARAISTLAREDIPYLLDQLSALQARVDELSNPRRADHVLRVEMGEFTTYKLTCNLDDTAECHMTCENHPEGGCGDPEHPDECLLKVYENGCVIAEWVNDGGIESVEFEHTVEIPVAHEWAASHDYPVLRAILTNTEQGEKEQ